MIHTAAQRQLRRFFVPMLVALGLIAAGCGSASTESTSTESTATEPAATAPTVTESAAAEQTEAPASPSNFPDFVGTTADGGQIDFGSLEGQDTVLWFWAPW